MGRRSDSLASASFAGARVRDVRRLRVGVTREPSPRQAADAEAPLSPVLRRSPYRDLAPIRRKFQRVTTQVTFVQNNPTAPPEDLTSFYWLYGSVDFKMEESEAAARRNAIRQIDRLVAKLRTTGAKGSVLFDIISTRKHIATQVPHRLGAALYRYVEDTYFDDVSTTFVGLTDNTARRVARDVFCQNKELSRQKYSFDPRQPCVEIQRQPRVGILE